MQYGVDWQGGDCMEITNIWDFLSWLWDSAVDFMRINISGFGFSINLWEWALGTAIISLLIYAIARVLD